jgi:hypothetical protein
MSGWDLTFHFGSNIIYGVKVQDDTEAVKWNVSHTAHYLNHGISHIPKLKFIRPQRMVSWSQVFISCSSELQLVEYRVIITKLNDTRDSNSHQNFKWKFTQRIMEKDPSVIAPGGEVEKETMINILSK